MCTWYKWNIIWRAVLALKRMRADYSKELLDSFNRVRCRVIVGNICQLQLLQKGNLQRIWSLIFVEGCSRTAPPTLPVVYAV